MLRKQCTGCKKVKSIFDFYKHPKGQHGRTWRCKKCLREYQLNRGNYPCATHKCRICLQEKHRRHFSLNRAYKTGFDNRCKACIAIKWAVYVATNPKKYKRNKADNRKRRAWLDDIKAASGCIRCGFADPRALLFHHRNPTEKAFNVSQPGPSKHKTLNEIAKCDVLCSNCHAIEHS